MKTNNGTVLKYRLARGFLLGFAIGAFFLPFASVKLPLPYFARVYTLSFPGLKSIFGTGLPSHIADLFRMGVLRLPVFLTAGIAALMLLCAIGVLIMLFLYAVSFAKPETAVKGLKITGIITLAADLLCMALGILLWVQTKTSVILSFSYGAGAAVLAALLFIMLVCDAALLKKEKRNVSVRPALAKILIVVLCVAIVCGGVGCGFWLTGKTEKEPADAPEAQETDSVYVDKLPESAEEAYSLLALKIRNVLFEKKERVESTRYLTVNEIGGTLSEAQRNVLFWMREDMAAAISKGFSGTFVDYGEDTEGALPDITAFSAPPDYSAKAVNNNAFQMTMRYSADAASALNSDETDQILNAAKEAFSGLVTVNSAAMRAKDVEVFAEINETNGVLAELTMRVKYNVSLNCTFSGELRAIGEQTVAFELTDNVSYHVSREGIYFSANVFHLAAGDEMELNAALNLPQNFTETDYRITYVSSNEKLLTVDENGVIRALAANDTPVTVTALLEFTNVTGVFYDYCEIYISE